MAYFARHMFKLASSAAQKTTCLPIHRRISSITQNNIRLDQVLRSSAVTSFNSITCQRRLSSDRDVVQYLNDEISYEEGNVKNIPKIRNFEMTMDGTLVTLRRNMRGEKVEVTFNVNDNENSDEGAEGEEDHSDEEPEIVSYPEFTVTITKSSGKTLLFNCSCSDEDADEDHEDGEDDLLVIDSVQVLESEDADTKKVYEANTDNVDEELCSMLMNTLLERGVNGTFVNELIDLSTAVEHRHYLTFIKSLRNFMNE